MSKDARNRTELTDEAKVKLDECVAALAACGFGGEGPPKDTSFAEIEEFGHEMGQVVARALDERLTSQHAAHFQAATLCPVCETPCDPKESLAKRELQTTDGHIPISEPCCHCPVCDRDFFPSAYRIEN